MKLEINSSSEQFNENNEINLHFINIKNIITYAFKKLGINENDKYLYYERYLNGTSVFAIQINNGDKRDISNYMVIGCRTFNDYSKINCDVYLYSNSKSSQTAIKIINLIAKNITLFFNEFESYLFNNGQNNSKFSILLPLYNRDNLLIENKDQSVMSKIFKRIQKIF